MIRWERAVLFEWTGKRCTAVPIKARYRNLTREEPFPPTWNAMERHRDLSDVQKNSTHLRLTNQTRRACQGQGSLGLVHSHWALLHFEDRCASIKVISLQPICWRCQRYHGHACSWVRKLYLSFGNGRPLPWLKYQLRHSCVCHLYTVTR